MSQKTNKKNRNLMGTVSNKVDSRSRKLSPDCYPAKQRRVPIPKTAAIPLILAVAIVPLIVYLKKIPLSDVLYRNWVGTKEAFDFFSYWKAQLIMVSAVLALIIFLYYRSKIKTPLFLEPLWIPLIIYTLFVIISWLFAQYSEVATFGFIDRMEGSLVLLSYVVLLFFAANIDFQKKHILAILYSFMVSSVIIALVGLTQFYGHDVLATHTGKLLILPKSMEKAADAIKFRFGKDILYGTLFNPNYVGSYSVLLIPVGFAVFLMLKDKKKKALAALLFCGAAVVLWVGSMSRAGLLGGILEIVLLLVLFRKQIWEQRKAVLLLVFYCVLIAYIMNSTSSGKVTREFNRLNPSVEQKAPKRVEYVDIDGFNFIFKTNLDSITMKYNMKKSQISFSDENNKYIRFKMKNDIITFSDKKYSDYKVEVFSKNAVIVFYFKKEKLTLKITNDGFKYVAPAMQLKDIEHPPRFKLLDGKERFASGRGFIWSRTIPMIKDTIFYGHGADTYSIYFPQMDITGKLQGLGRVNVIVDKPHNGYLQIAVNTGLLSLLAILAFLALYAVRSIRTYFPDRDEKADAFFYIGKGIFCAVCGYCLAAIFNDSVVSVAPIFWVLLGLGIGINRKIYS